jgi:hypothetical protein
MLATSPLRTAFGTGCLSLTWSGATMEPIRDGLSLSLTWSGATMEPIRDGLSLSLTWSGATMEPIRDGLSLSHLVRGHDGTHSPCVLGVAVVIAISPEDKNLIGDQSTSRTNYFDGISMRQGCKGGAGETCMQTTLSIAVCRGSSFGA